MTTAKFSANKENWTVADSSELYGVNRWGDSYFSINKLGHINVNPKGPRGGNLDLMDLVKELESRNLKLPLLIRFDDILEDRLIRLNQAFEEAIAQYNYKVDTKVSSL